MSEIADLERRIATLEQQARDAAKIEHVDFAIGMAHGVRYALEMLVRHVSKDDRDAMAAFAARLDAEVPKVLPEGGYASFVATVLQTISSDLTISDEEKQALAEQIAEIRGRSNVRKQART